MEISQYLNVFMDECQEHLLTLNKSLLELEQSPDDPQLLDQIFRAAHTLKGASATMGFNKMANLTHAMEDILSRVRLKELAVTPDIVNVFFEAVDLLDNLAKKIGEGREENIDIAGVIQDLRTYAAGENQQAKNERRQNLQLRYLETELEQISAGMQNGLRIYHIDVSLVQDCFLKGARVFMILREIEKMGTIIRSNPTIKDLEDENFNLRFIIGIISAGASEDLVKNIINITDVSKVTVEEPELAQLHLEKRSRDIVDRPEKARVGSTQTVRVEIKKLDDLMNLVGELVISRSRLESLGSVLGSKDLDELIEQIGRLTIDLRDSVMKARMVPVESVFSRFPRLVRDVAKELGKGIDLEIRGGDTEIDRTVIDEIGDPLVHIIRNAVDHGIESSDEREKLNKAPVGKVILNAYQEGNNVIITVTDDGRGFDVRKVKEKALKLGLISPETLSEMRDDQILEFTFLPGFSTADTVTDLSGRGVGMDVVKTKVDSLGGMVTIESIVGEGTTIRIRLPLTLAIVQSLMIQLGKETYAIPSGYIEQIISLNKADIKRIHKQEVFTLRGEVVPLIRLQEVLGTPDAWNYQLNELDVVVLNVGERLIGCIVDGLLRQQDVVIKSLGGYLGSIKGIAGATILGDGTVALILDIRDVA
jgi:two-component system, chemotaxis family, sensor kinase CheA